MCWWHITTTGRHPSAVICTSRLRGRGGPFCRVKCAWGCFPPLNRSHLELYPYVPHEAIGSGFSKYTLLKLYGNLAISVTTRIPILLQDHSLSALVLPHTTTTSHVYIIRDSSFAPADSLTQI